MEVLSKNDGLLTNIEVLELMQDRLKSHDPKKFSESLENREYIEKNTVKYLLDSMKIEGNTKAPTSEMGVRFFKEMARLAHLPATDPVSLCKARLTEAELLELSNHMPIAEVELFLLVADGYTRCSDLQVEAILAAVRTCFELPEELAA
jgi:hypothetical protein